MDNKGIKHPMTVGNAVFNIFNYTFLIILTLLCIYPFYYVFINSISANELSARGDIIFVPRQVHITNYLQVIRLPGLPRAAFISVSRTVLGTAFSVLACGFLGYLFTKPMWGRKFWYRLLVASMYVNAGLIPYFITLFRMGFMNSFWVYVIPLIVQPFCVLLVKTYVESTPISLQESAEMDGAGPLRIFFYIILPLSKPILATVAILVAVGQWNAFMDTLLFVTNQSLWTMQFILQQYLNDAHRLAQQILAMDGQIDFALIQRMQAQTPMSVRMTVTMIVTFPILLVYPFFQRYFTKGIMIGAVKG
ncbi:MAG: carbohydrate ABC transporter permease [Defluviitaleaceae bacterium]|nr:carbohydrate ABC transporter permease [Defluviitaleaceae bacterium]